MVTKYHSINSVVEDVIDWGEYTNMIDRVSMKKWANDLMRKLEVPDSYIHKIASIDVEEHKAVLPDDFSKVVQIAFRDESERKVRRTEIVQWVQKSLDGTGCEYVIDKKCPKCSQENSKCECNDTDIVYNVDRNWELLHPEFKYNHMKHYYRHGGIGNDNKVYSPFHPEFVLMKPSKHNYFNADLYIPGCLNLESKLLTGVNYEYHINEHTVEVNKEKGKILLAYLATRIDEDGYRMIPDIPEVFEALRWYAIESIHFREINKATNGGDRQHHMTMWQLANAQKTQAMGRANELLNTPDFEDWLVFLEQNLFKMFNDQSFADQLGVRTPDKFNQTMSRLTDHR